MDRTALAAADTRTGARLPLGVYLLSFSLFAMGSAEFLLAGVLPAVADDLDTSLASAGALISAFAVGVVVGGPPLAVLTLRWPRRAVLVTTQAVFAVAVAAGLVASTYQLLLVSRFVSGVAYAGFWAVAAVTAVGLVTPDRTARATGVVVSGLSLAMVVGGPVGALVSHATGWRGGFWVVVGLTLAGALAVRVALPDTRSEAVPSVRGELRSLRSPLLWVLYLVTILSTAAYMVTYNYLAALLTDVTGLADVVVPAVLVLFGLGALLGLAVGGRVADRRPHLALLAGAAGIAGASALLALGAEQALVVVPMVLALGVAGFVLNPAIYGRVFAVAAAAPTLAGATTVSAFQLGISLVPLLAGASLSRGGGVTSVAWIGTVLAVLTVSVVLVERRLAQR